MSVNRQTRVKLVDLANASPPINPILGECWIDTSSTRPVFRVYDGSSWVDIAQSGDNSDVVALIIALS